MVHILSLNIQPNQGDFSVRQPKKYLLTSLTVFIALAVIAAQAILNPGHAFRYEIISTSYIPSEPNISPPSISLSSVTPFLNSTQPYRSHSIVDISRLSFAWPTALITLKKLRQNHIDAFLIVNPNLPNLYFLASGPYSDPQQAMQAKAFLAQSSPLNWQSIPYQLNSIQQEIYPTEL